MQWLKNPITEAVRLKMLCWFGHAGRMEENRIPRKVLYMNLGTTRMRGRPRNVCVEKTENFVKIIPLLIPIFMRAADVSNLRYKINILLRGYYGARCW